LTLITPGELVRDFGEALDRGTGSLFVGAGLSVAAGYPGWGALIDAPRRKAGISKTIKDMPLMAEYIVQQTPGGEQVLHQRILSEIADVTPKTTTGPASIARLQSPELWTTNYDCLLENASSDFTVIASEQDMRQRHRPGHRRLIKLHGSLTQGPVPEWLSPPIITRRDYENFEVEHPRMWQALRSSFLTRTFLFLRFSFSDPNVELLLRLARSIRGSQGDDAPTEHFTVFRQPTEAERKLHDLRVDDLTRSGIAVCEVPSHSDLEPLLQQLVRRTRPKRLFITGSGGVDVVALARDVGDRLAQRPELVVTSLAGKDVGQPASFAFGNALMAIGHYDAEAIRFYFRARNLPGDAIEQRTGTAIYTGLTKEKLRPFVLNEARAMLVVGGATNTREEVEVASALGVPVVPLAVSGGEALSVWTAGDVSQAVRDPSDEDARDWTLLNDPNTKLAVSACQRLVFRAMFLQ